MQWSHDIDISLPDTHPIIMATGLGEFLGSDFYGYVTDVWSDDSDVVNLFFLQKIIPQFLELSEQTRDPKITPTQITELANYEDIQIGESLVTYNNENKVYRVEYSAKTDSDDELVNNLIAYVVTPNEQAVLITFIDISEFDAGEIDLILGSIR